MGTLTVKGKAAARGYNKVDKRLRDIIEQAAERSRFNVEVFSGIRTNKTKSQHVKGRAIDVVLSTPSGEKIPNLASKQAYDAYHEFSKDVYAVAKEQGLEKELAWGGNFSPTNINKQGFDLMHFDLGGARGKFGSIIGGLNDLGKAAIAKLSDWGQVYSADGEFAGKPLSETAMAFLGGAPGETQVASAGEAAATLAAPGMGAVQGGNLRKGMSGEPVRDLQRFLSAQGYNVGAAGIDGKFGGDTAKAVAAYQRDRGLALADGKVGPETRGAIIGDLKPPSIAESIARADLPATGSIGEDRIRKTFDEPSRVLTAPGGRAGLPSIEDFMGPSLARSLSVSRETLGNPDRDLPPTQQIALGSGAPSAAQLANATDSLRRQLQAANPGPTPRPNPTPTPNQEAIARDSLTRQLTPSAPAPAAPTQAQQDAATGLLREKLQQAAPAAPANPVNDTIRKSMERTFDIMGYSPASPNAARAVTGQVINSTPVKTESIAQKINRIPSSLPANAGTGGAVFGTPTGSGGFGTPDLQRAAVGAFQATGQPSAPAAPKAAPAPAPGLSNGFTVTKQNPAQYGATGMDMLSAANAAASMAASQVSPALQPVDYTKPKTSLAPLPPAKTVASLPVASVPGPIPTTDIPASMMPQPNTVAGAVAPAAQPSLLKKLAPGMILGALTGGIPGMAMSGLGGLIRGSLGSVNNPRGLGFDAATAARSAAIARGVQASDLVGNGASYGRRQSDGSVTGTTSSGTGYESRDGGKEISVGGRTYKEKKSGGYSLEL